MSRVNCVAIHTLYRDGESRQYRFFADAVGSVFWIEEAIFGERETSIVGFSRAIAEMAVEYARLTGYAVQLGDVARLRSEQFRLWDVP